MYSTKLSPDGLYAGIILMARRPYYFLLHRSKRASKSGSGGRAAAETRKTKFAHSDVARRLGEGEKETRIEKKPMRFEKKNPKPKKLFGKKNY